MSSNEGKLFLGLGVLAVAAVGLLATYDLTTIHGSELGVRETWGGVDPNPMSPATFVRNRWTHTIYRYDMTTQMFVMNDTTPDKGEAGHGRDYDPYVVQSSDQQDMHINLSVRWRFDPTKIVSIHQNYHAHVGNRDQNIIEERLLRNTVQRVVKNHATEKKAIEAYSGNGLVELQASIEKDLADPNGELRLQGVIVENFVIEKIGLDAKYTEEIKARQIAQQQQLRAVEETKASEAMALKAKADAQANLNTQVVGAERDKQIAILKAEQDQAVTVLAAKADGEKVRIAAEADASKVRVQAEAEASRIKIQSEANKISAENNAAATLAQGKAVAESNRLRFDAYNTPGAQTFAQIEISQNMGTAFRNFNGFLPPNSNFTLLSGDFMQAVRSFAGNRPAVETPASK